MPIVDPQDIQAEIERLRSEKVLTEQLLHEKNEALVAHGRENERLRTLLERCTCQYVRIARPAYPEQGE